MPTSATSTENFQLIIPSAAVAAATDSVATEGAMASAVSTGGAAVLGEMTGALSWSSSEGASAEGAAAGGTEASCSAF